MLAVGDMQGFLYVYNLEDQFEPETTIQVGAGNAIGSCLLLNATDLMMCSSYEGHVSLVSRDQNTRLLELEFGTGWPAVGLAQNADGSVFINSAGGISLLDLESSTTVWSATSQHLLQHSAPLPRGVHTASFSRDWSMLVTVGGDGCVAMWDPRLRAEDAVCVLPPSHLGGTALS